MAGSYHHVVHEDDGRLLSPKDVSAMLENGGDVYEAVEEMYGMIWWLAEEYARSLEAAQGELTGTHSTASMVEDARQRYREGLELSPGIGADLDDD